MWGFLRLGVAGGAAVLGVTVRAGAMVCIGRLCWLKDNGFGLWLGGAMPNGRRRPYRCGGMAPSPEHSSDDEDTRIQKAAYWVRATWVWRRWRRRVRDSRRQWRFVSVVLMKHGLGIGGGLVRLVLRYLGDRGVAYVYTPRHW